MSVTNRAFEKAILEDVDAGVLNDVLSFVRETSPQRYCLPSSAYALRLDLTT